MSDRTCVHCGASIAHRAPQARSCERCRSIRARDTQPKRGCVRCGAEVVGRHVTALICLACHIAARPIAYPVARACVVCATDYLPLATNQLTCGAECSYLHGKFGQQAKAAAARDLKRRDCAICGTEFSPRREEQTACGRRCHRLAWARRHPLYVHVRRDQMRGTVLDRDWRRLLQRHDHRCAYCGTRGPLAADHVVPLSRGGRHSIGNLLPACKSCNSRKHTKFLTEWRRALALAA